MIAKRTLTPAEIGEIVRSTRKAAGLRQNELAREDKLALSTLLPKRAKPFARRECRPFFGDLPKGFDHAKIGEHQGCRLGLHWGRRDPGCNVSWSGGTACLVMAS